jgi:hypothetical protein
MDVDLEDLDDGENYVLYVRATGDVDNDENDETCASEDQPITIVIEDDFAVLRDFQMPETFSCGDSVDVGADVWNIGESDQDEVSVRVYIRDLNIDEVVEVGDVEVEDGEVGEVEDVEVEEVEDVEVGDVEVVEIFIYPS